MEFVWFIVEIVIDENVVNRSYSIYIVMRCMSTNKGKYGEIGLFIVEVGIGLGNRIWDWFGSDVIFNVL